MWKKILVISIILLLTGTLVFSQTSGNLHGKVIDPITKLGVAGVYAEITTCINYDLKAYTDKNGDFVISKIPFQNLVPYQLEVSVSDRSVLKKYCQQMYIIQFKMEVGKDVYLEPIVLKPGCKIHGKLILPESYSSARVFRMRFHSKNQQQPEVFNPYLMGWDAQVDKDGNFQTEFLPTNTNLIAVIEIASNTMCYESQSLEIKTNDSPTEYQYDFTVPYYNNAIIGKITDKDNKPISGIEVDLSPLDQYGGSTIVKTDSNGNFKIQSIMPNFTYILHIVQECNPPILGGAKPIYAKTYHVFDLKFLQNEQKNIQIKIDKDNISYTFK